MADYLHSANNIDAHPAPEYGIRFAISTAGLRAGTVTIGRFTKNGMSTTPSTPTLWVMLGGTPTLCGTRVAFSFR